MCCSLVSVCSGDIPMIHGRPACNVIFSSNNKNIAIEEFKVIYLCLPLMKALVHNTLKSWPTAAKQFHRVCCQKSLFRDLNVPSTRATLLDCPCLLFGWQTIEVEPETFFLMILCNLLLCQEACRHCCQSDRARFQSGG